MNAGAYGGEISDHLVSVEVIRKGRVLELAKQQIGFTYRHSGLQNDIILSACFKFPPGGREETAKRRRELLIKRNEAQPVNVPNSGSIFKNPAGNHAAKLIEQAGLKGTRSGNAQISERHANFIVNLGGATARDVMSLIDLARTAVKEKFGVELQLEVKLLGFSNNMH